MFSRRQPVAHDKPAKVVRSDAEWQQLLSPEQYRILRRNGTEPACSSPFEKSDAPGTYCCAGCEQPLFSSTTKYNSGSGWPSFYQAFEHSVDTAADYRMIIPRTEVHCSRCSGHLGHVFKDGPQPTGLRYCVNGVSLTFIATDAILSTSST